jgi:hypothetical protein
MDQFVTSSRPNVPQNEGHLASQAIDLTKSQLIELTTERILVELFSRVNFTSKTWALKLF